MKVRNKILISIFFVLVILSTLIGSYILLKIDMAKSQAYDDIFGTTMDIAITIMFLVPTIIAEIDIFYNVLYFFSDISCQKRYKTILNSVACAISCVIILSVIANYFGYYNENVFFVIFGLYLWVRIVYLVTNFYHRKSNS